jgi:hypothetical protein
MKRGWLLYEAAMRWRGMPRSHQRGAKNPRNIYFGEVTLLLDQFLREDREMREAANGRQTEAA